MRYLALLALFAAVPAAAQSPQVRAANTITQADIARRIGIVADDSMMGRDTPSPGLEKTAAYVAGEFRRLGLKPGGDSGTFFQRYPLTQRQIDAASSSLIFQSSDVDIPISFSHDAFILFGDPPAEALTGDLVIIGGKIDPEQIPADQVKDRVVVWPVDFTKPLPANASGILSKVFSSGGKLLVVISNRDSTEFNTELASRLHASVSFGGGDHGGPLVLEVRERAVTDVVPTAAQDFERMRNSETIIIQPMPEWSGTLAVNQRTLSSASAPNSIGILEGSDPQLKDEYVVFSAHMDHIGITPGKADSINNGADDDGSGTVGVLELAEAFTARGVRPRRSVIFMTVSGEEKGLWGSEYFATTPPYRSPISWPTSTST
ncbi:MAG: M28 family peptidase [Gemmatimonadota bacterium]